MQDKYAILVDKTREALERQNKTSDDLRVLIKHSHKSKLFVLFKKKKSISKLFLKLSDCWSFFDYEFLLMIIDRFCTELTSDIKEYLSHFEQYCQRRLCEVPNDVFKAKKGHKNNLYVKCDEKFEKITLDRVKKLELKLSKLLGTDLYLLRVDEGCIELIFYSSCELFPLNDQQCDELFEMEILRMYSDCHKCYYNRSEVSGDQLPSDYLPSFPDYAATFIPDDELCVIAQEVQKCNKVDRLIEVLEIREEEYDVRILLDHWQNRMKLKNVPARPHLLYHLAQIGMQNLHTRSIQFLLNFGAMCNSRFVNNNNTLLL